MRLPRVAAALLATLLVSGPARAERVPHHYIVLEVDAAGRAVPVHHTMVALEPDTGAPPLAPLPADAARIDARVLDRRGELTYSRQLDVPVLLRAEPGPWGGALRIVEVPTRSFVVRVPATPGGTLVLSPSTEGAGRAPLLRSETRVELDAPNLRSTRLPLAASSVSQTLVGPPANRMDLLVMGDGYTAAQAAKFSTDADALFQTFFSISPYAEYAGFVNQTKLFTASAQSGADHPPYCPGGGTGCCSDPDAAGDGLAGTFVNTAFDATYCAFNIHRLLTINESKVFAAAAATPDWDKIMVVVNDTTYGGAGGAIATVSTNQFAVPVAQHEFGHSFTLLADEYTSPYPGFPACSDITAPPCEPNVTNQTSRSLLKWNAWVLGSTPIPTPDSPTYDGVVGLFQGARYQTSGYYRPRRDCGMNTLGTPFCEICKQAYVLRLYGGGWGVPSAGIRLIEPGSPSPAGTYLTYTQPVSSQTFSADVLAPAGLQSTWWVNGVQQANRDATPAAARPAEPTPRAPGGAGGGAPPPNAAAPSAVSSFSFTPPAAGTYAVELRAKDATTLVSATATVPAMESKRTWLLTVKQPGGCCSAGDANFSGVVDVFDVVLLSSHIVGNQPAGVSPMLAPAASMNLNPGSGPAVDIFDLVIQQNFVVGNVAALPQ